MFQATTKNIKTMLGVRSFAGMARAMKTAMLFISKKSQELPATSFRYGFISMKPVLIAKTVRTKSSPIRSIKIDRIRKSIE